MLTLLINMRIWEEENVLVSAYTSRAENPPKTRDKNKTYSSWLQKKVMSTKLSFSCYSTFQYYASGNQFAWLDVECLRYIRRDTCTLRKICHLKGCYFVCLFWYLDIFKRIFYLHQTSLNYNDIPIIIDDKPRLCH